MYQFSGFLLLCLIFNHVSGRLFEESFHLRACPNIEPARNFDMRKFLGIWYVIQKTKTVKKCMIYNFINTPVEEEYKLEVSGKLLFKHRHTTDTLNVPDSSDSAKMTVNFEPYKRRPQTLTVFSTDYETYAAVVTCKKLFKGHKQSATILSRTRTLDSHIIQRLRNKLWNAHIDPFELSTVDQSDCPQKQTPRKNPNNKPFKDSGKDTKQQGLDQSHFPQTQTPGKNPNDKPLKDSGKDTKQQGLDQSHFPQTQTPGKNPNDKPFKDSGEDTEQQGLDQNVVILE